MLIKDYERLNDNFLHFNQDTIRKYLDNKAWYAVPGLIDEKRYTANALSVVNFV